MGIAAVLVLSFSLEALRVLEEGALGGRTQWGQEPWAGAERIPCGADESCAKNPSKFSRRGDPWSYIPYF